MGCCSEKDKGEVFKPRRKRWCTDVICLLLLIAAGAGMLVIAFVAISAHPGLIYGLIYPTDAYGNYCGRPGTATESMPKVFYPDLDNDLIKHSDKLAKQQYLTFLESVTRICAPECPQGVSLSSPSTYGGASYPTDNATAAVPTFTYVYRTQEVFSRCFPTSTSWAGASAELCVTPKCTDAALDPLKAALSGSFACAVLEARPDETTTWEVCPSGASATDCALRDSYCTYKVQQSAAVSYLPDDYQATNDAATASLASKVQLIVGAYDSVLEPATYLILFGAVFPSLFAVGWCVLLWVMAGFVIYLAIFLTIIFEVLLSAWLCYKSGWFDGVDAGIIVEASSGVDTTAVTSTLATITVTNSSLTDVASADEQAYYQIAAALCIALTVLSLILICAWQDQIQRAIAIVKEVTKIFRTLPVIMVWSLQHLVFQLGLLVFGLFLVMWCLDDEVWTKVEAEQGIALSTNQQALVLAYCVLVVLWLINWVSAIAWASMSGAVGYWFVHDNAPGAEHRCCKTGAGLARLADSTWTIVSKHLGSLAVSAFVIAVCQTLRIAMKVFDEMTKEQQKGNLVMKLALKCAQCCMWCLQKTVEFVSYYGFVFVAIEGCSFCWACKRTFGLLITQPAQVTVNQIVKKLLGFLMTWSNPCLCAALCFYVLDGDAAYKDAGYEAIYPSLFVFLCAYVIAANVATVYGCSIDTILVCSIKDISENPDDPKYLSNDLRKAFGFDKAAEGSAAALNPAKQSGKVAPEPQKGDNYVAGAGGTVALPYTPPPTFGQACGASS